jgi:hypothetical protein
MSLGYKFDPHGKIAKIVKLWEPKNCKTEKDYEQSLLSELRKNLKGIKVQSQYGAGSQIVDIVVDDKIPIELKKDLLKTSSLHITIGQIEQYLRKWETVFLILCGSTSPDIMQSLKEYAKDKETFLLVYEDRLIVIDKTYK